MQASVLALLATSLVVGVLATGATPTTAGSQVNWQNPVRTAEEDQIKRLPGVVEAVKFNQYSGYLQSFVPGGDFARPRYTHYWLVEAQNNASEAPLLVWLSGWPGASSLSGMFNENGPFEVAKDGKTVKSREFSWNKLANVLYLETPVDVGFSYASKPEAIHTDSSTINQVWLGLESFFAKFPRFRSSQLYLTGEGYGANLALNVAAYHEKDLPNLAAFIGGNGYLHAGYMNLAGVLVAHRHGWINMKDNTWARMSDYCCDGKEPNWYGCEMRGERCASLVEKIYTNVCEKFGKDPYNINEHCSAPAQPGEPGDSRPLTAYLNQRIVRDALNIPAKVPRWQIERNIRYYMGNQVAKGDELISQVKSMKVPLVLYNGDADLVCSTEGTEMFVDFLGRPWLNEKPWEVANKTVGSVKEYEGLCLVTVNDAGHFVPRDKPQLAFELVKSVLKMTKRQ